MAAAKHVRRVSPGTKKQNKEYFIWCDESDQTGKYFSNFYGGVLVKSKDLKEGMDKLQKVCKKLRSRR